MSATASNSSMDEAVMAAVTDVNETHDSGDGEPVSPVDVDVDVGVADGSGDGAEAAAGNDDDGAGGAGDGESAGNAAGGAEHTAGSTGANVTVANDTGAGVASTAEADNPLADLAGRLPALPNLGSLALGASDMRDHARDELAEVRGRASGVNTLATGLEGLRPPRSEEDLSSTEEEEEIGQEEQAAIAKRLFVTKLRRFAGLPSDVSVSEIPDETVVNFRMQRDGESPADFANRKGTHPTTVSVHYLSYDKEGQAEMNGRTFFSRTTDITYSNTVTLAVDTVVKTGKWTFAVELLQEIPSRQPGFGIGWGSVEMYGGVPGALSYCLGNFGKIAHDHDWHDPEEPPPSVEFYAQDVIGCTITINVSDDNSASGTIDWTHNNNAFASHPWQLDGMLGLSGLWPVVSVPKDIGVRFLLSDAELSLHNVEMPEDSQPVGGRVAVNAKQLAAICKVVQGDEWRLEATQQAMANFKIDISASLGAVSGIFANQGGGGSSTGAGGRSDSIAMNDMNSDSVVPQRKVFEIFEDQRELTAEEWREHIKNQGELASFEKFVKVGKTSICAADDGNCIESWQFMTFCAVICVIFAPLIGGLMAAVLCCCLCCFCIANCKESDDAGIAATVYMAFLLLAPEPALALLSVSIYLSDRAALAGRELEVFAPFAAFIAIGVFLATLASYSSVWEAKERRKSSQKAKDDAQKDAHEEREALLAAADDEEEVHLSRAQKKERRKRRERVEKEKQQEAQIVERTVRSIRNSADLFDKPSLSWTLLILIVLVAVLQAFLATFIRVARKRDDDDSSIFGETSNEKMVVGIFIYSMFFFTVIFLGIMSYVILNYWSVARRIATFNTITDPEKTKFRSAIGTPQVLRFKHSREVNVWSEINDALTDDLDEPFNKGFTSASALVSISAVLLLTAVMVIELIRSGVTEAPTASLDVAAAAEDVFSPLLAYAVFDLVLVTAFLLAVIMAGVQISENPRANHISLLQQAMFDIFTRRVGADLDPETKNQTIEGLRIALQGIEAKEPVKILGLPLDAALRNKLVTLAVTGISTGAANIFGS